MANGRLDIFKAGSLAKGLNTSSPDFQADVQLSNDTSNVTSGIVEGIGPRYGMAPIPGHSDTETLASGANPGLMKAEGGFGGSSLNYERVKLYALIPVSLRGADSNIKTVSTYYVAVVGSTSSSYLGDFFIDVTLLGINDAGATPVYSQTTNIYDGLCAPSFSAIQGDRLGLLNEFVLPYPIADGTVKTATANYLKTATASNPNYASVAQLSVSGPDIKGAWIVGKFTGLSTDTAISSITLFDAEAQSSANIYGGRIPEIVYGNFKSTNRNVVVYGYDASFQQIVSWQVNFAPSTTYFLPVYVNDGSADIDLSSLTATKLAGTSSSTGTAKPAVYNDESLYINSSYKAILVAANKAFCYILQDWYREVHGQMPQYFDLVNNPLEPPTFNTFSKEDASAQYEEDSAVTQTSFAYWPSFTRGTAMSASSVSGVALGAANSGLLRANTVYEFGYSIFNKRLNYETNVGKPVKIQTGTDDFISLILFDTGAASFPAGVNTQVQFSGATTAKYSVLPFAGWTSATTPPNNAFHLNYLEYRFYYRQEGMIEWLPALFIDAVQWWCYGPFKKLSACTGGIGGLVGGRPGGFNDYSKLPADNYTCVVTYKNRTFWLSEKNLIFSPINNIFAYPANNSIACPLGSYKGAIVQAYYGQAVQDARLVVFSTRGTYVGKFTGNLQQVPVQVSPTTVANFGLDGSDFVLDTWTSETAFSYRSAVVGEGILYFWGPEGIFRDDGVNPITRISIPIEPNIFTLYDPNATDDICCTYNNTTKEVIWFYPPKGGGDTKMLIFNVHRQTFLPGAVTGNVYAAQNMTISSNIKTAGSRTLIIGTDGSSAVQRAVFFDQNNLAGDFLPKQEMLIKTISSPSTGVRRLTLASGYDATNYGTIKIGDYISFQQCGDYGSSLSTPADFIAEVTSLAGGAGTIDVTLPAGVSFDASATISNNYQYVPIWHAAGASGALTGPGISGFAYKIKSNFWVPNGMAYWARWLYLHQVFKLFRLLSGIAPVISLDCITPISVGSASATLTLANNSSNNYQVLHPLIPGASNFEGQGIALTWSGYQIGGSWVLQFVEAYAQMLDGMQIKHFEG